jgi:hypothetical protein
MGRKLAEATNACRTRRTRGETGLRWRTLVFEVLLVELLLAELLLVELFLVALFAGDVEGVFVVVPVASPAGAALAPVCAAAADAFVVSEEGAVSDVED